MAPSQSPVVPIVAIMSQIEQELQGYVSDDLQVRGSMIVSSVDSVVRIDHRLAVDSMPSSLQNLYWNAKRFPEALHRFIEVRGTLRESCGIR